METANDNTQPGDLLIGAKAVAKSLGITPRQLYHLIEKGLIPTFRLGASVAARRSSLTKWMEEQERAARQVAA